MKGVFVTGTGTGVGKTVLAAALTMRLGASYWKPIQSGWPEDDDTDMVTRLTGCPAHVPLYRLKAPRSPMEAAEIEGIVISPDDFRLPDDQRPLVVEGAGGVLVPIAPGFMMIDLMAVLGLPLVVAADSRLGTINHTLLTLEALRARGLEVLGVAMIGPADPANRKAIESLGRVRVLAEIPPLRPLDTAALATVEFDMP